MRPYVPIQPSPHACDACLLATDQRRKLIARQVAALATFGLLRYSAGKVGFAPADLLSVPSALLGTAVGMTLYKRLSDKHFARAVYVLLIVSGIGYFG